MTAAVVNAAQLAKAALRRLAVERLEPTPENYARAWAEEGGGPMPAAAAAPRAAPVPAADEAAWGPLIDRLVRGLDRGGREWTGARRRDSVHRLLAGSGGAAARLQTRLQSLLNAWEGDAAASAIELAALPAEGSAAPSAETAAEPASTPSARTGPAAATAAPETEGLQAPASPHWPPLVTSLGDTLRAALPGDDQRASALADRLAGLARRINDDGASAALVAEVQAVCVDARRLFVHRHHLVDELSRLCRQMTSSMVELAEDDSWVRGQCEDLRARLADGLNARSVRAAGDLLARARDHQVQLRTERNVARDSLKLLVQGLLREVGELDAHTGRFEQTVGRHADAIARADTLDGLATVVRELVDESHAVRSLVRTARERMADDRAKAAGLESRVLELEGELRRMSDEATTDALTQVANRRGLGLAFDAERARAAVAEAAAPPLAIALIDIDNFKKLNDSLGHLAGDLALQKLAAGVRERLRPVDHLARFGGEEFVVLLPATPVADAQRALTRLQRGLTESLFLHEGREVFVTFSCGVTAWRHGETLEAALERADEALFEAKRTGKNRSCVA